jgi:hypothetical protein
LNIIHYHFRDTHQNKNIIRIKQKHRIKKNILGEGRREGRKEGGESGAQWLIRYRFLVVFCFDTNNSGLILLDIFFDTNNIFLILNP